MRFWGKKESLKRMKKERKRRRRRSRKKKRQVTISDTATSDKTSSESVLGENSEKNAQLDTFVYI